LSDAVALIPPEENTVSTSTTEAHPLRRSDVEAWLDALKIPWQFDPEYPLDKISVKRSLANQARLEPINQEVVDRYTADVKRGDEFPPVLVNDRKGHKENELLGGNHRMMAYRFGGRTTIPAYVVSVEPEMALRLTYEDNRRHGLPPSESERVVQAIHLIENGWTQERAAAAVGVAGSKISAERTMIRAGNRAKELRVDEGFAGLARNSKYHLGRLRSDPVFTAAANLVVQAKMSVDEVKSLCNRLHEARSDEAALNLLGMEEEEFSARVQRSGGGRVRATRTPRAVLLRAVHDIVSRDADAVVASVPNAEARSELRKEVTRAIEHLESVRKALR
jgi:ParB-like chromosome segregation protein Spo0J